MGVDRIDAAILRTRQESITNLYQSRSGGRPDRCSRTNRSISRDGTCRQAVEVDRIDAAVLAKELTEIYSTPTPKGWLEPKKVSNLYWSIGLIVCFAIAEGPIFIPGA